MHGVFIPPSDSFVFCSKSILLDGYGVNTLFYQAKSLSVLDFRGRLIISC